MLILATTTDKIQVLLTSAVTTNQLDCIATYKDISTTAYSGSSPTLVTTNNTTAVDLVEAPASNVQRIVDFISVYNADTVNAIVTIRINRNGSTGVLFKCILSTNELLVYVEGKGWNIHSSSGLSKQSLLYDNSNITTNPNYLINSAFQVAQRTTSATITAGTATPTASLGYPVVDNWFCYSVGGNPTLTQVAGSNTTANRLQLTGAASITSVGIGQRLEAINTTSLANKTVTLSFECSNSLLTSLTVVANRPTTTTNTFGTIGFPSKTLINSTNVAINSTLTRYSVTFTCPQEVDRGLEILFLLGAQTSGTFVLSNVKLEEGSIATPYVTFPFDQEIVKCKRYFQWVNFSMVSYIAAATGSSEQWVPYSTQMRAIPIIGVGEADPFQGGISSSNLLAAYVYRATLEGVATSIQAAAIGGCYLFGIRYPFFSYIP
jgi:hypothetical protein